MINAIVIIPFLCILIWLFFIRPYCIRNRKGYTPGAAIGVTFWVDWQEAREIARAEGNARMILVCRAFLWLQILWAGLFLVAIFGAVAG